MTVRLDLANPAKLHRIDNALRTIGSVVNEARDRGIEISYSTIYARLRAGIDTMDALLAPVDKVKQKNTRKSWERRRAEMDELLARMGPPKRY